MGGPERERRGSPQGITRARRGSPQGITRARRGSPQGIPRARRGSPLGITRARRGSPLGIPRARRGSPLGIPAPGATAAAWLRASPPPEGAVVVRLAFDARADLDLYVTGPRRETVYFANTPTKLGGRLDADRRCDAPAPRIETVVFPEPWPGPYRVGVDFPEACDGGREPADFALDVHSAAGLARRTGRVRPGEFEPMVLEWDEPATPDAATD